jgi:hypothetical protein
MAISEPDYFDATLRGSRPQRPGALVVACADETAGERIAKNCAIRELLAPT